MEKNRNNNFLSREREIKEPLAKLHESYALLYEFSNIVDFDEKRDLDYFSDLYLEIRPIVNSIVIYVVNNKLAGIKKNIDEFIFTSQKILSNLKALHIRAKLINGQIIDGEKSDWYEYSPKESGEIIHDLRFHLEGLKNYFVNY